MANKPHCYGKMDWILNYPEDNTPKDSICDCQYTNSCLRITRNKAECKQEAGEVGRVECSNQYCYWNWSGQCCHESEEGHEKATPNMLDCPSSLRSDFEEQLLKLLQECREELVFRNMRQLLEVRKLLKGQGSDMTTA